jgi:large subunit ribosomal protein L29
VIKVEELRGESATRLNERLLALKKEQFNLRFQKATGQLESTTRVREVRRDIARVRTVLREKARQAAVG